jgi:hypothetical protein
VRALLKNYLDQRVLFYLTRYGHELQQINAHTGQLQTELWSAVNAPAAAQPTPVLALALSGMNDVLNSQRYTQQPSNYGSIHELLLRIYPVIEEWEGSLRIRSRVTLFSSGSIKIRRF